MTLLLVGTKEKIITLVFCVVVFKVCSIKMK